MKEAENNGNTNITDASVGNTEINHKTGSEAPEAQMDMDFSNDDLLGEENELCDAAYNFLGVQKGNSVNVRNAATLTALAPARFSSQHTRPGGKPVSSVLAAQTFT